MFKCKECVYSWGNRQVCRCKKERRISWLQIHTTKLRHCSMGDKRKGYLCLHKIHKAFSTDEKFRSTPMLWLKLARCKPIHTHFFLLLWSCKAFLGILWPYLHLLHFNLFSLLASTCFLVKSLVCKFTLKAFQPLYSVSESYKKAADVFRRGWFQTIVQGGETTMKLEKSV